MAQTKLITGNGDTDLGAANPSGRGIWLLKVTGIAGANITVKSRTYGSAGAYGNKNYTKADGTAVAAGTTITADGEYEIDSSGADIRLTTAGFVSAITLEATPLIG
jgi:hypothetical protein